MTSVKLQRTIPASPDSVYRAWLDPDLLLRWSAPVEYEAVRVEVDERVGGHYRCWHVDAQGRDVGGYDCEILELVPTSASCCAGSSSSRTAARSQTRTRV